MIVVVKRLWGRGPSLLATLLGGIATWYFILEPRFSFNIANPADALNLAAYFVIGTSISFLGEVSGRLSSAMTLEGGNIKPRVVRQTAVLASAAVVLAGMVLLLLHDFKRSQEAEYWVAHTYQVMNSAESVLSTMKDAETGERGFLLTGDETFLAPYNSAIAALPHGLKRLKDLTSDNPLQQARLVEINGLTEQRLTMLRHGIELRKAAGVDSAIALVRSGQGLQVMDELRSTLDAVKSEERRLLAERNAQAEVEGSRERWVLGLGSAAMILLLVFASMVIDRETVRREEITEDLRRHADLLEQAHDCLLICRLGGAIEYWSHGAEILFGYSREEAVGRFSRELLQTYHPLSMAHIDATLERDGEWKGELTLTAKDGRKLIVDSQWTMVLDAKGNKTVLEANRDITERKRAEERLHESETQFRTLANAIPQLCWMANADGWIFWYNDRWYEYTGTTPEQMAGWGWQSVHDPEELPKVMECWRDSLATGKPFDMVFPLRGADGAFRPFLTRIMPVCDQDGKVTRWFGTNTDISEQRRIEQELRESEAVLRSFFDSPGMMRGMVDLVDGCITHVSCNEAAAQLNRSDRKSLVGKTATEAGASEDAVRTWVALYERARNTGKPVSGEYARRDAQGRERWLLATASYMGVGPSGNPRFAYTMLDLTERRRAEDALRESEARLRTLGDNLPEGAIYRYRLDANGQPHVDFISAGIERLTGVPAAKFMSDASTVIKNVAPEDRERLTEAIAFSAEHLTRFEVEVRHKHRATGETHWCLLRSSPTRFPDGSMVWDGIELDITERKRAEEELRESEERFRALITAGSNVVYRMNADWNEMRQLRGQNFIHDTEKPNRNWIQEYIHPDDQSHVKAVINEAIRTKSIFELEHRVLRVDGTLGWTYSRAVPLLDAKGEIVEWFGAASDITARKHAEAQNLLLATAIEQAAETVVITDRDANIQYVNPVFTRTTGYTRGEAIGQNPRVLKSGAHDAKFYHELWSTITAGRIWRGELTNRRKGGTLYTEEATIAPVRDVSGNITNYIAIKSDITERKQAEEALRKSELKFSVLFHKASIPALLARLSDGTFVDVNDAWTQSFGYTKEELLGKTSLELGVMRDAQLRAQTIDEVRQHGQVVRTEQTLYSKSGDAHTALINLNAVEFGGEEYALISVQDITERKQAEEALRQSEEHFRSLFDHMLNGFAFCQMLYKQNKPYDFIYLSVNKAFEALTGLKNVEGKKVSEIIPGIQEADPVLIETYGRVALTGVPQRFETYVEALAMWFSIAVYSPKKGYFVAVFDVITERKQAEMALRENEMTLRLFVQHAPASIAMLDREMRYLVVSQRWMTDYHLGDRDISGLSHYEVFPEVPERWKQIHRRCMAGAVERGDEDPFPRPDGSTDWLSWEVRPWRKADDSIGGIIIFSELITERKQAEAALAESELHYRQLFERSESALGFYEMIFDAQGNPCDCRYIDVNPAWERIIGRKASQVLGRTAREINPDREEYWIKLFGQVAATREPTTFEHYTRHPGRYYAGTAYSPRPNYVAVTFMDVTERKRAEEEARLLNLELEDRVRSRTAALESANRELEAFAHSVSHDLRAPLRGIDGWSLALMEDYAEVLDAQGQKYLDRVRSEAQRMGRLIDDLLHLSRVGRAELVPSTVDLTSLAGTIIARLQEANPGRCIEIIVAPQLQCTGDARLLEVALTNLLGNAVKFTGHCNLARIEFGKTDFEGNPAFFVRDNGVGFDMAYAKMLFAPFQRLHKASEFPGTGIGLATVQRVIHRHGGRIWAEAQVGEGATLYFTLGENKP
jgi:PAS domain S-box-containing protein